MHTPVSTVIGIGKGKKPVFQSILYFTYLNMTEIVSNNTENELTSSHGRSRVRTLHITISSKINLKMSRVFLYLGRMGKNTLKLLEEIVIQ